jgi:histone H2A
MSQSAEHKKRKKSSEHKKDKDKEKDKQQRKEERKKSKAIRAGLTFPPSRFQKQLKRGAYAPRIGFGAGLYMAAIVEYLCAEVLELAGNAAKDNNRLRVSPRHVMLAVRNDDELNRLLDRVHIANSGVIPSVHRILLHTLEQRRRLQEKGELPSDNILCSQLTPEFALGDLDKKRRSEESDSDYSHKKKKKKKRSHSSNDDSDSDRREKKKRRTSREKEREKEKEKKRKKSKSSSSEEADSKLSKHATPKKRKPSPERSISKTSKTSKSPSKSTKETSRKTPEKVK